jgi:hypothetical protein
MAAADGAVEEPAEEETEEARRSAAFAWAFRMCFFPIARPFDPYSAPLVAAAFVTFTAASSDSEYWGCGCASAREAPSVLRCMRRAGGA